MRLDGGRCRLFRDAAAGVVVAATATLDARADTNVEPGYI